MHQIVLMSAIAVTSGLFGGGRTYCTTGQCGGYVAPQVQTYQPAPTFYQQPAYVYPTAYTQPAAYPTAPAFQPVGHPQHRWFFRPVSSCPNGACPVR